MAQVTDLERRGRSGSWRIGLTVGIAALILALDQVTKAIVLDRLGPDGDRLAVHIIPGLLRLIYVENTGAAFGFFRGNNPVLTVLALAVIGFLLVYFRRAITQSGWLAVALGLQFGGALGNVVDRMRHGFVVDFIDVSRFPTFNVADSAITVGVVILGLYLLTRTGASHESANDPAPDRGVQAATPSAEERS